MEVSNDSSSIYKPKTIDFLQNGAWVSGGKIVVFFLSFALMTMFARLTGKNIVGSYNFIVSVLAIVSILTLPGMSTALIRAVARGNEGSYRAMTRKRLRVGLFGSILCVGIAVWYLFHSQFSLGYAFLIAAPFVPLTDMWSEMAFAYWTGKQKFRKSITLSLYYQILFVIPSIVVLAVTNNLIIITGSLFLFQTLGGYVVYKSIKPNNDHRDYESEQFGIHLTVLNALRIVAINIDKVIAWFLFGPIALALYVFAATPISKLEQLLPIEQLALPYLTLREIHDQKKLLLRRSLNLFALSIPLVILLYSITPFIYRLLFPGFDGSVHLFRVLLILPLLAPLTLLRTSFTAWRKQNTLYTLETISLIVKTICMVTGGLLFGLVGLVWGIAIAKILESVLITILFQFIV